MSSSSQRIKWLGAWWLSTDAIDHVVFYLEGKKITIRTAQTFSCGVCGLSWDSFARPPFQAWVIPYVYRSLWRWKKKTKKNRTPKIAVDTRHLAIAVAF